MVQNENTESQHEGPEVAPQFFPERRLGAHPLYPPSRPCELKEALARALRSHVQKHARSGEAFAAAVCVNKGHLNEILNGKVDTKVSTLFKLTRSIGCCPNEVLCEACARTYESCLVPLDPTSVPKDARTLRDLHVGHPHCRRSDWH